jgi:hypothetical protein
MARSVGSFGVLLLLAGVPALLGAQTRANAQTKVSERRLEKADAEFPESFDQIGALRELPGGKVLVVDLGPKSLLMADFKTGEQTAIGRNGQGPGEYQFPGELIPYLGDSTLLVDRVSRRFLTVSPDGKLGKTVPFPDGLQGMPTPRGSDSRGRIYLQTSPFRLGGDDAGPAALPESTAVVRWDRSNNKIDTVTRVKIPATKMQRTGTSNARIVMMRPQPYAPQDEWAPGPDGRVAVARVGDYHVEWLGDRPARGTPVSYQPIKVTEGDRTTFMDAMKNTRNRITITNGGGRGGQELRPPEPSADEFDWPEYKPPFRARSALVTSDGQLWVQRHTEVRDSVPVFDVFDASGNLASRVYLPKGRQVVGLGQGAVYAVRTDSDGLQWLERYRR